MSFEVADVQCAVPKLGSLDRELKTWTSFFFIPLCNRFLTCFFFFDLIC